MTFEEFGLAAPVLRAVTDEKHLIPTPIQIQAIPPAMLGRDLVGVAQTGTGKTAAFALPILNRLAADKTKAQPGSPRVLVLSPTRELAGQIAERFRAYGRHVGIRVALVIGGVSMGPQKKSVNGSVDVLVATPGRLLDLVQSRAVRLDRIETLVLDEADRMLDMGFIRDIRKIVAMIPVKRQTMLFSATMPREITSLADSMMHDPVRVAATPDATMAPRVEQRVMHVDRALKPQRLIEILLNNPTDRTIVFMRTKHSADKVVRLLAKADINSVAIHGNKSQNQRESALAAFRDKRAKILIATDIAARGIDVVGIDHVINFDLPNIAETYVHRIGRTARAGADGRATSFCAPDERADLKGIEKLIGNAIEVSGDAPPAEAPRSSERKREANGGQRRGPRPEGRNNEGGQAKSRGPRKRGGRSGESGKHRPDGVDPVAFILRPRERHEDRKNRQQAAARQ